jgi:hypothetical protein
MDIRLNVETQNLNLALKEMQRRMSGYAAPRQIIEYEAGKVMEAALARVNKATKQSIEASQKEKEWATYDLGSGTKHYKLSHRYPNALWAAIEKKKTQGLAKKLAAIGLSKALFLTSIEQLGQPASVPGYVREAKPRHREDSTMTPSPSQTAYVITFNWDSPLINKGSNFTQALFSAIRGRARFFAENAKRGVFDQMSTIAAKYPGLIVSR